MTGYTLIRNGMKLYVDSSDELWYISNIQSSVFQEISNQLQKVDASRWIKTTITTSQADRIVKYYCLAKKQPGFGEKNGLYLVLGESRRKLTKRWRQLKRKLKEDRLQSQLSFHH